MQADFEAALSDPNLLSARRDIATLAARQADLAKRVDSGEAGVIWAGMRKGMKEFRIAQRTGDKDKMLVALNELEDWVAAGSSDYLAWKEYLDVTERIRKLRDTERRLLEAHNAMVTIEEARALVAALVDSVTRHVADAKARQEIGRDIERFISQSRP